MTWGPEGDLYVSAGNGLFVYDNQDGAFLRKLPFFAPNPFALHFTPGGDLLVSSGLDHAVYRINPSDGQVIAKIQHPMLDVPGKMLALPDGSVLVTSSGLDQIVTLDLESNMITGVFSAGGGLDGPFGIRYGPDGMIYTGNLYGDAGIRRIDPATGQVLGLFAVDPSSRATTDLLFAGPNTLWSANILSSTMDRFDASSGALLHTQIAPAYPWSLLHMPEPGSVGAAVGIAALSLLRAIRGPRKRRA
jgi:hypothetical protein